ncbi:transglutaminase domain-containing protein [candidate division KSB1 bacterium]|nr:transglutaminase domain-containing protein [candidate division KSB1 bacterium]
MKRIEILLVIWMVAASAQAQLPADVQRLIALGEYSFAQSALRDRLAHESFLTSLQQLEYRFEIERLERIKKDFTQTESNILPFIRTYLPDITSSDLTRWEENKSLESRLIDGEKRYFNYAHYNLFRIDPTLRRIKAQKDAPSSPADFDPIEHSRHIVETALRSGSVSVNPLRSRITYSLAVHADAVPPGKMIRCWLPYAMEIGGRQENVRLISTEPQQRIVSDNRRDLHRTVYLEKPAVAGQSTDFKVVFEMTSLGYYQPIDAATCRQAQPDSELEIYLAERPPHVVFTPEIRVLSREIVGDETNPYRIAQKLFAWIDHNIPWASAREYSTFRNISDYVYHNRHADCGMQTLFFITLCRLNGIPARWQSGWYIEPSDDTMHDWGEIYFAPYGWVPMDVTRGLQESDDPAVEWFNLSGMDAYRWIINSDYSQNLYPTKIHPRSETIDFQRGEVEWEGGNLYFDQWDWDFAVEILN